MFFWLSYFRPKSFGFICIQLLVCFRVISQLLVEFFFVVLECPVFFFLYCFTLCRYLFNLPSFASTFWLISSSSIVIFSCVAFSFLFLHIPSSYLCFIILACFRRFFYLRFQSNFPSGFDFFFVLFEGIPIFSQTNFASA